MHYEVTIKMCRQCAENHQYFNKRTTDKIEPQTAVTHKDFNCYYCGSTIPKDKTQANGV